MKTNPFIRFSLAARVACGLHLHPGFNDEDGSFIEEILMDLCNKERILLDHFLL